MDSSAVITQISKEEARGPLRGKGTGAARRGHREAPRGGGGQDPLRAAAAPGARLAAGGAGRVGAGKRRGAGSAPWALRVLGVGAAAGVDPGLRQGLRPAVRSARGEPPPLPRPERRRGREVGVEGARGRRRPRPPPPGPGREGREVTAGREGARLPPTLGRDSHKLWVSRGGAQPLGHREQPPLRRGARPRRPGCSPWPWACAHKFRPGSRPTALAGSGGGGCLGWRPAPPRPGTDCSGWEPFPLCPPGLRLLLPGAGAGETGCQSAGGCAAGGWRERRGGAGRGGAGSRWPGSTPCLPVQPRT